MSSKRLTYFLPLMAVICTGCLNNSFTYRLAGIDGDTANALAQANRDAQATRAAVDRQSGKNTVAPDWKNAPVGSSVESTTAWCVRWLSDTAFRNSSVGSPLTGEEVDARYKVDKANLEAAYTAGTTARPTEETERIMKQNSLKSGGTGDIIRDRLMRTHHVPLTLPVLAHTSLTKPSECVPNSTVTPNMRIDGNEIHITLAVDAGADPLAIGNAFIAEFDKTLRATGNWSLRDGIQLRKDMIEMADSSKASMENGYKMEVITARDSGRLPPDRAAHDKRAQTMYDALIGLAKSPLYDHSWMGWYTHAPSLKATTQFTANVSIFPKGTPSLLGAGNPTDGDDNTGLIQISLTYSDVLVSF